MKKNYILFLAIIFGAYVNSYSQTFVNSYSLLGDELVEILGNNTKGTYLKDFKMDINPVEKSRYSIVLSKNTKYEFSYYEHEPNQIEFTLYDNNDSIVPQKINKIKNITRKEYIISNTGIYHMFVKNNTFNTIKTVILLSFIEKIKPIIEDESIIQTTNQENTQNKSKFHKDNPKEQYFFVVEEMPSFNDAKNIDKSKSEFLKFINKEIKYPQEAIDKKIEGKVFVQFVIDKDGYIKEAKIISGVHPSLDQEALSVVYSSPRWQPGKQRGLAVKVVLTFPIEFKLP